MDQTTAGLTAIARNARRLLSDAELLLGGGRFPTAAALAILALEEAGKFFIIRWSDETDSAQPSPKRPAQAQWHQAKQQVVGTFDLAEAAVSTVQNFVRDAGLADDDATVQMFLAELDRTKADPDHGTKALEYEERLVTAVAQAMANADRSSLRSQARQETSMP